MRRRSCVGEDVFRGEQVREVLRVRQDVVAFLLGHIHETCDRVPDTFPGLGRDDAPAVGADVSGWRSWGVTLVKLLDA